MHQFVLFLEIWLKSEFKFKCTGKKEEIDFFQEDSFAKLQSWFHRTKISSVAGEPSNKVVDKQQCWNLVKKYFKY